MSAVSGDAGSLWHALASAPDSRCNAGKRYPLASLLLIAVAALLSGRRDQLDRALGTAADPRGIGSHRHHAQPGAGALGMV
jgi:hypothetical protein